MWVSATCHFAGCVRGPGNGAHPADHRCEIDCRGVFSPGVAAGHFPLTIMSIADIIASLTTNLPMSHVCDRNTTDESCNALGGGNVDRIHRFDNHAKPRLKICLSAPCGMHRVDGKRNVPYCCKLDFPELCSGIGDRSVPLRPLFPPPPPMILLNNGRTYVLEAIFATISRICGCPYARLPSALFPDQRRRPQVTSNAVQRQYDFVHEMAPINHRASPTRQMMICTIVFNIISQCAVRIIADSIARYIASNLPLIRRRHLRL